MRNNVIIASGLIVLTAGLFAFSKNGEDKKSKKYEVIHHSGEKMITADTIIPAGSSFTPEDFVKSLGIESKNIQIMEIPSDGEVHTVVSKDVHWVGKDDKQTITDADDDHKSHSEEVRIEMEIDDDGNKTCKKWVNGTEVPCDPNDLDHGHMDMDGIDGEIIKKIEIDTEDLDMDLEELLKDMKDGENAFHFEHKIMCDSAGGADMEEVHKMLEGMDIKINIDSMSADHFIEHSSEGGHKVIIMTDEEEGMKGDQDVKVIKKSFVGGNKGEFTMVLVSDVNEKSIANNANELTMTMFPNPAEDKVSLTLNSTAKGKGQVQIHDLNGKIVMDESIGNFKGETKKNLDISKLNAGIYVVKVKQGKSSVSEKLVVR